MIKKQHVSSLLKENKWYNKVSYIPSGGFIDTLEIFFNTLHGCRPESLCQIGEVTYIINPNPVVFFIKYLHMHFVHFASLQYPQLPRVDCKTYYNIVN